jgi:uncharacterized membrane protein YphA (DoxX/SURF4 family)
MLIEVGVFTARLLTGGILLIAGIAKLRTPSGQFLTAIMGYDLLPKPIASVTARGLPWLEVAAAVLLISGLWSRLAVLLGFGLLLVFSSAVAISLLRGKNQNCGCFDSLTPVQWRLVYRNLILMALLLPVYAFSGSAWSSDNQLSLQLARNDFFPAELAALSTAWLTTLIAALLLQRLTRQRSTEAFKS